VLRAAASAMGCGPSAEKDAERRSSSADEPDPEPEPEPEGEQDAAAEGEGKAAPIADNSCISRARQMDDVMEAAEVAKLLAGVELGHLLREESRIVHVSDSLAGIANRCTKLPHDTADSIMAGLEDLSERALVCYLVEFESQLSDACGDIWPPRRVVHIPIARQAVVDSWDEVERSSGTFQQALHRLITGEYLLAMHYDHCRHRDMRLQNALKDETGTLLISGSEFVCKQYGVAFRQYQRLLDGLIDSAEMQAKTAVQFELDRAVPKFFKRYDLDLSGKVNSLEGLDNLTTNLLYSFREYVDFPPMEQIRPLMEQIESSELTSWDVDDYTEWFNERVRNRTSTDTSKWGFSDEGGYVGEKYAT